MFRGAEFLYKQFVRPWFARHQGTIEAQFQRLADVRASITTVVGVDPLLLASRQVVTEESSPEEAGVKAADAETMASIFAAHGQAAPNLVPAATGTAAAGGSGKRE